MTDDSRADVPAPKDLNASSALIVGGTAGIGLASAREGGRATDRCRWSQPRTWPIGGQVDRRTWRDGDVHRRRCC